MDFDSIELKKVQPEVRKRYLREIVILQGWLNLSVDEFQVDYFSDDNIDSVKEILAEQNISDNRRSEYIRSISAVLTELHIPHKQYQLLMKEYGKTTLQKESSDIDISIIRTRLMEFQNNPNIHKILRIMSVTLLNNVKTDITKLLTYTMADIQQWSPDVYQTILDINGTDTNCFGHMTNLKQTSKNFKTVMGYTYTAIVKMLNKPKIEEPITRRTVIPIIIDEWSSLPIVQIHKDNIRRLMERVGIDSITMFNDITILNRIKELDIAANTKLNYVTAICVLLDYTAGVLYSEYTILRMELELHIAKENMQRKVPCFTEVIKSIRKCYDDETTIESVRIMCLVILNNVIGDNDNLQVKNIATETGVLRPSDLINTTFDTDGVESYISIKDKLWVIKKGCTKNKQDRILSIDDDFIEGIQSIYKYRLPNYLVTAKGEKYTGSMSDVIKQYTGYNFDTIRASYFTWRNKITKDRKELIELCRRQGHKYSTAMMNYNRLFYYTVGDSVGDSNFIIDDISGNISV